MEEEGLLSESTYTVLAVLSVASAVFVAGFSAGLTMGLVPIDPLDMNIILASDPLDCDTYEETKRLEKDKASARKILPLVEKHHALLISILILNSIAAEALPILLTTLVSPYMAVVLSVILILVFVEIVPAALFTGPRQLEIAASLAPIVQFIMTITYCFTSPIASLLDSLVGCGTDQYNKAEFRALVSMHAGAPPEDDHLPDSFERSRQLVPRPRLKHVHNDSQMCSSSEVHPKHGSYKSPESKATLSEDERKIIHGTLTVSLLTAQDLMLPMDKVYMMSTDDVLDMSTISGLLGLGHSRIPVYEKHPHNIRGILMIKRLLVISPEDNRRVGTIGLRLPLCVGLKDKIFDILKQMQSGRSHICIVTDSPVCLSHCLRKDREIPINLYLAGIVTLEDIMEKMISRDISDETEVGVYLGLKSSEKSERRRKMLREMAEVAKAQRLSCVKDSNNSET